MTGITMQVLTLFVVVAVSCLPVALSTTVDDCPESLSRNKYLQTHEDKCYYFYLNKNVDFSDASDACHEKGGILALVKTEDINSFLHTTLEYRFSKETSNDQHVWIGLTDLQQEGHFKWLDGSTMKYQNFQSLQGPDGLWLTRLREDCVAMSSKSGKWYDYHCQSSLIGLLFNEHRPFICEYNAVKHKPAPTTPQNTQLSTKDDVQTETSSPMPLTPLPDSPSQNLRAFTQKHPPARLQTEYTAAALTFTVNGGIVPTAGEVQTHTPSTTGNVVTSESEQSSDTTRDTMTMTSAADPPKTTVCPSLVCNLDCGLDGYARHSTTNCMTCACNQ